LCNLKVELDIFTNIGQGAVMIQQDITAELIGAAKEYPVVTGDLAKNFFLRGQE
jgi:hypothetical protein